MGTTINNSLARMKNITLTLPIQLRTIAFVTALALLAMTVGLPAWIHQAKAGGFDTVSDVMTDTDLGLDSEHSITFTTDTELNATDIIRVTFDPTDGDYDFDFTGMLIGDVSSSTTHNIHDAAGSCGGGIDFYVTDVDTATDHIDYTVCAGDTVPAATTINLSIGVDATNFINNPATADSYVINITSMDTTELTTYDEADTRVAVIDDVTVTAAVDTIFTFSINGVAGGVTVNDDTTQTFASSTATTVPFGIIAPATPKLMAQELRVDTNALNGFSVTVFADQTLTAGNGATIDPFIDGTEVASSTVWQGPAGTLGLTDTYGHWGITSDDDVTNGLATEDWGTGEAAYRGNFIDNPVEVFYNNTPVEYTQGGIGVGSTTVAYKVEISNLQEAAKDYTATLTYIATPVF